MKRLVEKIENVEMTFWQMAGVFITAVMIRNFLESYTNVWSRGYIAGITDMIFHFPSLYLGVGATMTIIFYFLTKVDIVKISRVVTIGTFLIILRPAVDLLFREKAAYSYIVSSATELLRYLYSFYAVTPRVGIGMKVEIVAIVALSGLYVFLKTGKIFRAIWGGVLIHIVIFLFVIGPLPIYSLYSFFQGTPSVSSAEAVYFFGTGDVSSSETVSRPFLVSYEPQTIGRDKSFENARSVTMGIIFLLYAVLSVSAVYYLASPKKFQSVIQNFRYERIGHYFFLIVGGMAAGALVNGKTFPVHSLLDFLSVISVFAGFLFAWLFAVWENDEADLEIDAVSNCGRPLGKSKFSTAEWKTIKLLFLVLALSFGFLAGYYTLVFVTLFILVYHAYSMPPLRLKRFLFLSSFLVACNCLIAFLSGYFISSGTNDLSSVPAAYILGILFAYLLAENVKNLKDIEGDRAAGIRTLPVLLGEKRAKIVCGGMAFAAVLVAPVTFFFSAVTFFTAIFFGSLIFVLINREKYHEFPVFLTYLSFLAVFFFEVFVFVFK